MSLYVNGWEFNGGTFNSNEIMSVYYNNVLVWERVWIGWERATWEDIYNLCKDKQSGKLKEWPDDIVLGARKIVHFSEAINLEEVDQYTKAITQCEVEIIGIDIDGDGVLTFDTVNCLGDGHASWPQYKGSYLEENCQRFYDLCDIQNYIKPLNKGTTAWAKGVLPYEQGINTGVIDGSVEAGHVEPTFEEMYVWPLSEFEIGLTNEVYGIASNNYNYSASSLATMKESTYDVIVPYPYFDSAEKRRKGYSDEQPNKAMHPGGWYLRSMYWKADSDPINRYGALCYIDYGFYVSKSVRDMSSSERYGMAAAFAIG